MSDMHEQLEDLRGTVAAWRWVPEILAGQKFESPSDAMNYLRSEFKALRAELDALKNVSALDCSKGDFCQYKLRMLDAERKIDALRAERDEAKAQMEAAAVRHSADGNSVNEYVQDLEAERDRYRDALKEICDEKHLRELSWFASNPPQNVAVYYIQTIARAALAGGKATA